jgi:hypothetical protein
MAVAGLFSVFTFHYFERVKKKGFILPYLREVLCNHNLVYLCINSWLFGLSMLLTHCFVLS